MVALLAAFTTYANGEPQKPLYIINGKVATIEEVKDLGDRLESMTVLKNKNEIKEFDHLGDTSNGVIVITLKDAEEEDMPFCYASVYGRRPPCVPRVGDAECTLSRGGNEGG